MPEARLRITVPEAEWVGKLTRNYPDATVRILAALANEWGGGVGLAEIHCNSIEALLAEMEADESIRDHSRLNVTDDRALVQFETNAPLLLLAAQDSGIPLEMPFKIADGEAVWELTAPGDSLSDLGTQLREKGVSFSIDYIQPDISTEELLTESQAEILSEAIEAGYYESPRACSLTELAEEIGLASSTVSETLHRAESKIVKKYAGDEELTSTE